MSQTPDDINNPQQKINFELVQIDRKLIETLKTLVALLNTIDFDSLEAAISRASTVSKEVADINPPGTSEQNSESFLKVARSLNLDGPPDWSSRIDHYLYRENESVNE